MYNIKYVFALNQIKDSVFKGGWFIDIILNNMLTAFRSVFIAEKGSIIHNMT
jgi:hypothetical protein